MLQFKQHNLDLMMEKSDLVLNFLSTYPL